VREVGWRAGIDDEAGGREVVGNETAPGPGLRMVLRTAPQWTAGGSLSSEASGRVNCC